ncbi:hypothetical protein BJV74DRAFT_798676 [Russula compacta]|nr:hypothetical protein BJV74DRAFT_798676 [Russula compacta]
MATHNIIFYTAKFLPNQVADIMDLQELAFQEAGADVTQYWIDLQNKPEWYASRVIPVMALVYRSPKSHPESLSPESAKLTESVVFLKFVTDLYPNSSLLPKDPVQQAHVCFFIDMFLNNKAPDNFIAAAAEIQELISPSGFAIRDHFMIADAAFAPFLGHWELNFRNDFGKYLEGAGPHMHKVLFQSERFVHLQKYFTNIPSHQGFKNSFNSDYLLSQAKDSYLYHLLNHLAPALALSPYSSALPGKKGSSLALVSAYKNRQA